MTIAATGCSLRVRREADLSARTVIMVPLRNSRRTLLESLLSALEQTGLDRPCLALLDDRSDDGWMESVSDLLAGFPHVVFRGAFGAAWRARNALLDGCDRLFREARWLVRLDADDRFESARAISDLIGRSTMGKGDPWALLGGNSLVRDGALLDRLNPADRRLLEPAGLMERVDGMAGGDPAAELPSCNLVLRPRLGLRYPPAASAEDHWLVARLLLAVPERVRIAEDILLTRYSLSGSATADNRDSGRYARSRRALKATLSRALYG